MPTRALRLAALLLTFPAIAPAQHVSNAHASVLDVAARQAFLKTTTDARLKSAVAKLDSCTAQPPVPAPAGHVVIPRHYLNGSHGATNPAEAEATRPYGAFEKRISAGADQYVATRSHAEAACSLAQLDAWAQAGALLDYDAKESTQAWFQVGWTLCSAAIADSILVNDAALDATQQKRVAAWLNRAAHRLISFEKPDEPGNNLHYWRSLAATAVGVVTSDDELFRYGVKTFKEAIGELDANGALPREMQRHERASHYQTFALQPLVMIAELATRQGTDLYAFSTHGRTLRDAIVFFGRVVDDPSLLKPYTPDEQTAGFGWDDFAPYEFFVARFGLAGMPSAIVKGLSHPVGATRIGGITTVLAGK